MTIDEREQLTLEHTTLLEHLRITRAEIDQQMGASHQIVHLTFSIVTAVLGVSLFVGNQIPPIIALILPLFLYLLCWVQVRYLLIVRQRSDYAYEIGQRVIAILKQLDHEASSLRKIDETSLRGIDGKWDNPAGFWLFPINASGYILPLFAAVLCILWFVFLKILPGTNNQWNGYEWGLIVMNVAALAYSLLIGFLIEFRQLGHKRINNEES